MRRADINMTFIRSAPTLDCKRTEGEGSTLGFADWCSLRSSKVKHYASLVWGSRLRFMDVFAKDADPGLGISTGAERPSLPVRRLDVNFLSDSRGFMEERASLTRWQWTFELSEDPRVSAISKATYRMVLWIRSLLAKVERYYDARAARGSSKKT